MFNRLKEGVNRTKTISQPAHKHSAVNYIVGTKMPRRVLCSLNLKSKTLELPQGHLPEVDVVGHAAMITAVLEAAIPTFLAALRHYVAEEVFSHHKGSKPISKSINAVARLRASVGIGPNYIKARVDVRYSKVVECRMSQRQRGQIVRVGNLRQALAQYGACVLLQRVPL